MLNNISFLQKIPFTLFFVCMFVVSAFGPSANSQLDLSKFFKKFNSIRLNSREAVQKAETGDAVTFIMSDRKYDLILTPNDLRSSRYQSEDSRDGKRSSKNGAAVTTFKGKVAGKPDSEARLTIDAGKTEGFFEADGEKFFVEAARNYSPAATEDELIIYNEKDLLKSTDFLCQSELVEKIEKAKETINLNAAETAQTQRVIELATDADFQFVTALGGANQANNEILSTLNMIEGVYEKELNLSIQVVFQHTWSTPDSFDGANAGTLVTSFQNYWNANLPRSQTPRDTAHLFSAKPNLLGQGLSYVGVVCRDPSSSYGFSGRINSVAVNNLITAHELAHNFGATHVDAAQNCANTDMITYFSDQTPLTYCAYSRDEIKNFVAANGSCLTEKKSAATPFDFDGDGRADVSLFRPSNGVWYLLNSSSGFSSIQFGVSTDQIAPADYDGDGKTDIAVFRNGVWYLQRSSAGFASVPFGNAGDIPQPADFDGDGKAELALFRPANGFWYTLNLVNNQFSSVQFGAAADVPVTADYDGDGKSDYAVFRPANGVWYLLKSGQGFSAVQFGNAADQPVPADYDADGRADVAVFRPSEGNWFIQKSAQGFASIQFGIAGDIPAPADFDKDGKADLAVFRPNGGTWYQLKSGEGFSAVQFGSNGDKPATGALVR